MKAHKLHQKAQHPVQRQVQADDGAVAVWPQESEVQHGENNQLTERFVKLRGMKRHSKRNTDQLVGARISEGHGPGQMCRHSPAAARGKTTQTADGMA